MSAPLLSGNPCQEVIVAGSSLVRNDGKPQGRRFDLLDPSLEMRWAVMEDNPGLIVFICKTRRFNGIVTCKHPVPAVSDAKVLDLVFIEA